MRRIITALILILATSLLPAKTLWWGCVFENIAIPQGADITNVYIDFTAVSDQGAGVMSNLKITIEDTDNAAAYTTTNYALSSRAQTTKKVHWGAGIWTANNVYTTPDLKDLVQDVVDRIGWKKGNALAFQLQFEATVDDKRDVISYDMDSARAPLLHVEYTQAVNQKYYGYFNPNWFYTWNSNKFEHAYKKIGYDTATCVGSWEVEDTAGASKPCLLKTEIETGIGSTGYWDGNWMNWAYHAADRCVPQGHDGRSGNLPDRRWQYDPVRRVRPSPAEVLNEIWTVPAEGV